MIILTTLPDHLHFYCIQLLKARITKEELKSVIIEKKIHFCDKIQYGCRLLGGV